MKKPARKTRRQLIAEKAARAKRLVDKANSLLNPFEIHAYYHAVYHEYTTKDNQTVKLSCIKASDATPECLSWVLDIMDRNMKQMYEQSQWGWDGEEKRKELTELHARYLIATLNDEFIGFSHFRFDVDYGDEVLYCYELQLERQARRKGLGRFMMSALESMAVQNSMRKVVLTVFKHNPSATQFFYTLGYKLDKTSPSASEQSDYIILSKQNLHG